MITITVAFVIAAVLAALSGLIGDEVRGWLELMPRAILRLVAMRLPAGQRQTVYTEEWLPELLFILRKADGRPITRIVVGTWFALSMIRCAGQVARSLTQVRENEQELVFRPADSDVGTAADSLQADRGTYDDIYGGSYRPVGGGGGGGRGILLSPEKY